MAGEEYELSELYDMLPDGCRNCSYACSFLAMLVAFESSTGGPLPTIEDIRENCFGQPVTDTDPLQPEGISVINDPFDDTKAIAEYADDVQPNAYFIPKEGIEAVLDEPCPYRDTIGLDFT